MIDLFDILLRMLTTLYEYSRIILVEFLKCTCDKTQSIVENDFDPDGITLIEAEHLGWRKINGEWKCPFCTGQLGNLKKLWDESPEPEEE